MLVYKRTYTWTTGGLLVLPAILVFTLFFVIPLLHVLLTSLHNYSQTSGVGDRWTTQNYAKFLRDPYYLGVLWRTIRISLVTTVVTLILGYPLAMVLAATKGRTRSWLILFLLAPLLVSMVIRAYGWVILLGTQGPVANLFHVLGLRTPTMLYTEFAIDLGMVHVFLAYMVLPILGSLENVDAAIVRAAANLGAGKWYTFRRVLLPLTLPGVSAGAVMVFSLTASSFVTPSILGGPRVPVMSELAYDQVVSVMNWPYGSAIGCILIVVTMLLLLIYAGVLRGRRGRTEGTVTSW
ncbi:ABC transporter permease [Alicyclobacillus macrosporangiidus]|uniref:Putative spermidine/putrescine transport system permease protein n=1 Tax=Alicyclobacillus macrosporangiidus TaxID=392015 RepID=A0A1I7LCI6_9BACL|nr:ABC transporter permease [Alicyclobacillus macrosporangiidus]SFV07415.1 putative spermidine/putrescine transport system permease protein [Alicyclobacillus macrosporangiidus]